VAALRAEHGEAPILPISEADLWTDPFQLMSVREIFISIFRT
jgi:hypothetical protein